MNKIIYILVNAAMPNYVKIGKTNNLERRLRSLYSTPVPLPFECFYACTVENAEKTEKWLFDIFDNKQVNK